MDETKKPSSGQQSVTGDRKLASQWVLVRDGKRIGPLTADQLRHLSATGQLRESDKVWRDGIDKPVPVAQVKGLGFSSASTSATSTTATSTTATATGATPANAKPANATSSIATSTAVASTEASANVSSENAETTTNTTSASKTDSSNPTAKTSSWFYHKNDKVSGPIPESDLRDMFQAGILKPSTLLAKEGTSEWIEYQSVFPVNQVPVSSQPAAPDPPSFDSDASNSLNSGSASVFDEVPMGTVLSGQTPNSNPAAAAPENAGSPGLGFSIEPTPVADQPFPAGGFPPAGGVPSAGFGAAAIQNHPMAVRRDAPMASPGPVHELTSAWSILFAVLSYIFGSIHLFVGGICLLQIYLAKSATDSMYSNVPGGGIAGNAANNGLTAAEWSFILLVLYGIFIAVAVTGLLMKKYWGWLMSIVASIGAIIFAAYYIFMIVIVQSAVDSFSSFGEKQVEKAQALANASAWILALIALVYLVYASLGLFATLNNKTRRQFISYR